MQTHMDEDQRGLLEQLRAKADEMTANKQSEITAGKADEDALAEWRHGDMQVRHMPDDEHGVCRVSIGGMPDSHKGLKFRYLVLRGSVSDCESILTQALAAIRKYK